LRAPDALERTRFAWRQLRCLLGGGRRGLQHAAGDPVSSHAIAYDPTRSVDGGRHSAIAGLSYLTSILTRDLRDIADVEKLTELPKFVRMLAAHSGQLVNYPQFGASINVSHKTGQRSVVLLEQVFPIATVQPWSTNSLKRIVKTPKLHFLDSGLLASVRGLTFERVKADRGTFGAVLESFVFSEVLKLMTASDLRLTPHHFRDRDTRGHLLERDDGAIVGIEVKANATAKAGGFGGLRALAETCGDCFAFGVVLYDSTDVVPFGDRLAAAPLSCLWG